MIHKRNYIIAKKSFFSLVTLFFTNSTPPFFPFYTHVDYKIYIYGTREQEDNSDECEVSHVRSKGAKTRVRIILFLPCRTLYFFSCMHRNGTEIRQRQFCINCRFLQRWSLLPILSSFRNKLTFWSVRWRHLMVAVVPPHTVFIVNCHGNYW